MQHWYVYLLKDTLLIFCCCGGGEVKKLNKDINALLFNYRDNKHVHGKCYNIPCPPPKKTKQKTIIFIPLSTSKNIFICL